MKRELEDWLTDLPPLDGDDEDTIVDVDTADDIEPAVEHDSLDDAAADNLDISEAANDEDEEEQDEADEQWSADVGEPELDLPGDEPADDDPSTEIAAGDPSPQEADLELDDEEGAADDAAEEGTNEPVEQTLDEELPALDADEDGDFEETLVADALGAFDVSHPEDERRLPRWADTPWLEHIGNSRALTWCSDDDPCLDVCSRGAAVIVAATVAGDVWAATGERVLLTRYASLGAVARVPLERPLALAMGSHAQTVWLIDHAGRLLRSGDGGFTWEALGRTGGPPLAAAARESAIALLAADGAGARLVTSEDGATWFAQRLDITLQLGAASARPWLALCGAAIAVGDAGGVWLSRDGQQFARVLRSQGATAGAFAGTRAEAPLVFAVPAHDHDGGTHIVRVDELGAVDIVAHLGARSAPGRDEDELFPVHLDWDDDARTLQVAYPTAIAVLLEPPAHRGPAAHRGKGSS